MSKKKLLITIISSLIIAVSSICIIFFNIDHDIKKVFTGYKYFPESKTIEETVVAVNGRVNFNIFEEDNYEFQIKVEGEDAPFDGRHLAFLTPLSSMNGMYFYPEQFVGEFIFGGFIKTNGFKDHVILTIDDYEKIIVASTKQYNDIYEMAKAFDCEDLLE